jgi:GNAT superfamily N-acetyltransferase
MTDAAQHGPAVDDVVLDRMGAGHHVREACPEDLPGIQRLLDGLSPRSSYQRFFSGAARSAPYTASLLDPGHTLDAVVVTTGGRVVGVASTHRLGPDSAELALAVEDDEQGHGVGTLLAEALVARGRQHGLTTLVGEVLVANVQMLDVLSHLGLPYTTTTEAGIAEVRIDLGDSEEFRRAVARRHQEAAHRARDDGQRARAVPRGR